MYSPSLCMTVFRSPTDSSLPRIVAFLQPSKSLIGQDAEKQLQFHMERSSNDGLSVRGTEGLPLLSAEVKAAAWPLKSKHDYIQSVLKSTSSNVHYAYILTNKNNKYNFYIYIWRYRFVKQAKKICS